MSRAGGWGRKVVLVEAALLCASEHTSVSQFPHQAVLLAYGVQEARLTVPIAPGIFWGLRGSLARSLVQSCLVLQGSAHGGSWPPTFPVPILDQALGEVAEDREEPSQRGPLTPSAPQEHVPVHMLREK